MHRMIGLQKGYTVILEKTEMLKSIRKLDCKVAGF